MELLITLLIISYILSFIFAWIKVSIFMWGAGIEGSSFKRTFAYMIGKYELQNLKDK